MFWVENKVFYNVTHLLERITSLLCVFFYSFFLESLSSDITNTQLVSFNNGPGATPTRQRQITQILVLSF